ncbi:metal-dependent phosphohydrolase, partial [Streptomyces sp. MUM 203J]|nr:metal-dependent phosphohydrolase [Streptomyces sp. MUM 203J]
MAGIPGSARGYITGTALCAAACAAPAFLPGAGTPWGALALLAALYALGELCARPARGVGVPVGSGSFFPVLLAAALLLPPPAAVLAALPGAMAAHVDGRAAPA